ncbi:MAG: rod-binding protein [Leptospiraceae bacterium]|nr:rod-binding protein [Leptospiraceae bacterium]MCK6380187.1 rod-binding protein [Leptospiraceae bacterium]NUM41940.1 rod-binding protein [Leptospiraceae bacterium]
MNISDYTNRLNLMDRKEVENIKRLESKKPSSDTLSNSKFQEILREEINKTIEGKLPSSSVKLPNNIKSEISSDPYRKKLYDASVEFESIFVKMMLKEMKKSVEKTNLIHGGYAEEIFEDMLYDEYAKNISKNESLGLAEEIYTTLSKNLPDR